MAVFGEIRNKITELEYLKKMVVLRSSPNDMEQLLKFSKFYLKPNLRNNFVKTVNFEILKSRDTVDPRLSEQCVRVPLILSNTFQSNL